MQILTSASSTKEIHHCEALINQFMAFSVVIDTIINISVSGGYYSLAPVSVTCPYSED